MNKITMREAYAAQAKMHNKIKEAVEEFSRATQLRVRAVEVTEHPFRRLDGEPMVPLYIVTTEVRL